MKRRRGGQGLALLALLGWAPLVSEAAGTVEGRVTLGGPKPAAPARIDTSSDPACARENLLDEVVVLGGKDGRGLASVVVRVVGPRPVAAVTSPVKVEQRACAYRPRVQGAVVGQPMEILNVDPTLHNVHAYAGTKGLFNVAQPSGTPALTRPSPAGPGPVRLRCDIHRWMAAWVVYGDSPFFAVTDREGGFRLEGVPPGHWLLEVWHETLGTRTVPVVVKDGERLRVPVELRAK
jgi:plastocyanin